MQTINIHQAKTQLSRLVERAAQGEPFVIAKAGKPLVKVMALNAPEAGQRRRLGFMAGQIAVPDDFRPDGRRGDRAAVRWRGVKLLLDTHLLLWAAGEPGRLSAEARASIEAPENELLFSAASLWEIAIKRGLGREDFRVDVRLLRRGLLDNGYGELPVGSEHAVAIDGLPPLHKDPFDRLLVAQALVEGVTLLTSDERVAQYPGPVRKV
ncbi:MAG: type II toxin-antitoxin system prevent-host-death family antitoxin [Albidovulum sp.]